MRIISQVLFQVNVAGHRLPKDSLSPFFQVHLVHQSQQKFVALADLSWLLFGDSAFHTRGDH